MSWVKHDDGYPEHRKVKPLSDAAYRLDHEATCWSSRNKTDGRIAADELALISKRGTEKNAAELVRRGRWHKVPYEPCESEHCTEPGSDGWVIHDYLDYNPSRAKVLKERKAAADRQARWRDKKTGRYGVSNGVTDGVSNASGDALVTPTPSRPVPSPSGLGRGLPHGGARASPEPPQKCPDHEGHPSPPRCGRCADHRRYHAEWVAARADAERAAPRCRTHRGELAHNCRLCRADQLAAQEDDHA